MESLTQLPINLLLIDPVILTDLFIRHVPFEQLRTSLITFAVNEELVSLIDQFVSQSNVSMQISSTQLPDKSISIDHLFLRLDQQFIQFAVLHPVNSYFLIRENNVRLPGHIKLSYGDRLRVLER